MPIQLACFWLPVGTLSYKCKMLRYSFHATFFFAALLDTVLLLRQMNRKQLLRRCVFVPADCMMIDQQQHQDCIQYDFKSTHTTPSLARERGMTLLFLVLSVSLSTPLKKKACYYFVATKKKKNVLKTPPFSFFHFFLFFYILPLHTRKHDFREFLLFSIK